jgi:hypothetical protein
MVKGINAENLELRYNSGLNQKYKIILVIPIKRNDQPINICKIELQSKDEFGSLGTTVLLLINIIIRQIYLKK